MFPAPFAGLVHWEKPEQAKWNRERGSRKWKVSNHSYRGVNPAYELTELTLATGSGESCELGQGAGKAT